MINGVSIPVLTPYKFYPVIGVTNLGVNFQNTDNTSQLSQSWKGVYSLCFNQPVPRYWNDYSPGIDFQVFLDETSLEYIDIRAALIDLEGNVKQVLSQSAFFYWATTPNNLTQVRFYADQLFNIDDGYYRIKIYENGGDDIYYSEIIELKDSFDDCYPLEYSNFENDFGLIFENASSATWVGKILIPMRLFNPVPSDTRETYRDDNDILTTLRSTPKRVYQLESLPVPTWMAEKIKMIFSCSDLTLNKISINSEETPDLELISQSDMVSVSGEVQLNSESSDTIPYEYLQQDELDTVTELLSLWYNGYDDEFDTFSSDGSEIDIAYSDGSAEKASCVSNAISVTSGQNYLLELEINVGSFYNPYLEILSGSIDIELKNGSNIILYKAVATTTINLILYANTSEEVEFYGTFSMKKIS